MQLFCNTYSIFELDYIHNEKFCETSSILELDTIQNEEILQNFLSFWTRQHQKRSNAARLPSKMESWVQSWRPRAIAFCDFSTPPVYILANLLMLQNQPLSGNQRPDLLTTLMNMSLVLRLPRIMHLCRSSSDVPRLPSFLEMLQNPHVLLTFDKVHNSSRLPRKTTRQHPKLARWCM